MDDGAKEVERGVLIANEAGEFLRRDPQGRRRRPASKLNRLPLLQKTCSAWPMSSSLRWNFSVLAVIEENTAATEQMAAGSSEVTQAIENIASVSEENSAAVEGVSASAEEMLPRWRKLQLLLTPAELARQLQELSISSRLANSFNLAASYPHPGLT